MDAFNEILTVVNDIIWHDIVLYIVLGVGVLFTFWSGFCQYRALTHGSQVIRGKYDDPDDPGAINHFQALSAALSATVGLGNIGGVAIAIALGGPGAVFWMWLIGLAGMALKTTEVTLSMMYRNISDDGTPHGGPMWVASKGFAEFGMAGIGKTVGGIFCVTLLISAITGGNMFQAWNVGEVTREATNGSMPTMLTGMILAVVVGMVIIGGIKRIGSVAGRLVPAMCGLYLLSAGYVIIVHIGDIPAMFALIVNSAFNTVNPSGAFIGGAWGYAFLWGMKRALFSSEAGQGSSPIAHAAAKSKEPVREAVVAGLEPFIDTIVVCTLTSLVILSTGAWNRAPEAQFSVPPSFESVGDKKWSLKTTELPPRSAEAKRVTGSDWVAEEIVFAIARFDDKQEQTGHDLHQVKGRILDRPEGGLQIAWEPIEASSTPVLVSGGIHKNYPGATLTAHAFDRTTPGLGTWLVLISAWLFALSTIISWSYYGEQGMVYLFGERSVLPYKIGYCLLILVATAGFLETDTDLDNLTALGTGVMLWANIPIMLVFGKKAMTTYHDYMNRLKSGAFHSQNAKPVVDVVEGRD